MKLSPRSPKHGPIVLRSATMGGGSMGDMTVQIGNVVTLEADGATVLVRVKTAYGRRYSGEIMGFDGTLEAEVQGAKEGDVLDFDHDDIHSCMKS